MIKSMNAKFRRIGGRVLPRVFLSLATLLFLGGCKLTLLDPKGPIGEGEKNLILISTGLMLLVVIPVIVLTLVFAWWFRASNTRATYRPKWAHSTRIEAVVWGIPCVIIVILGTLAWTTTHTLDPYRPLAAPDKTMVIDAVSLDWKWLFIYPDQRVATVNELAFPAGTPVEFHVTSDSVMNSFFIPGLGGQIYSMAGMQTKISLLADAPGEFEGMSSNYSGAGFSGMKFKVHALSAADFASWLARVKASPSALDAQSYAALAAPSQDNPVAYYSPADPKIYDGLIAKYLGLTPDAIATMQDMAHRPTDHTQMDHMNMDHMPGMGAMPMGTKPGEADKKVESGQ